MNSLEIPEEIYEKWQRMVDTLARIVDVPATLVMRIQNEDLEVFVTSKTNGNPYTRGDSEVFDGSGLYCETVIKTRNRLLIPDATQDADWNHNPDIKLGMIAYLGYPINLPDGNVFGTLCVLDKAEEHFSDDYKDLMKGFKELIKSHLLLIHRAKTPVSSES